LVKPDDQFSKMEAFILTTNEADLLKKKKTKPK
jgi:hypothetical protein